MFVSLRFDKSQHEHASENVFKMAGFWLLCMLSLGGCALKSPEIAENEMRHNEAKANVPTAAYTALSGEIRDLSERLRLLEGRMDVLAREVAQQPAGRVLTPQRKQVTMTKAARTVPVAVSRPPIAEASKNEQAQARKTEAGHTPVAQDLRAAALKKNAAPTTQTAKAPLPRSGAPEAAKPDSMQTVGAGISPDSSLKSANMTKKTASAPVSKPASGEKARYAQALATLESGRSTEAEKMFIDFVASYPQSALLPNALYWRGEALYARRLYADAILAFKEVMNRFPQHHKAADSTLKAAMSYARLGDRDNASLHYQVLQQDYPQSQALQTARRLGLVAREH